MAERLTDLQFFLLFLLTDVKSLLDLIKYSKFETGIREK